MQDIKEKINIEEIWKLFRETDRKFKETGRLLTGKFQETDRLIKEARKAIGELGGRLGQFVEEMVKPAAFRLFQEKGFNVRRVIHNMEAFYDDRSMQVDLVVINGSDAVIIECKSSLSIDDVNEHVDRLARFKDFWPEYKNLNLFGAVAGMAVPDNVSKYAYRQGLYVMVQNGEIIEIKNDEKFKPKSW